MSRQYFEGVYVPLIGYLKEQGSSSFEDLKARFMINVTDDKKEEREQRFQDWINKLIEDHIVLIEYDRVIFNEEQWNRICKMNN